MGPKRILKYLIERASSSEIEEKRDADALEAKSQPPAAKESERTQQAQISKEPVPTRGRQQLIAFAQRFEEQVLAAIKTGAAPFEGDSDDARPYLDSVSV